MIKISEILKREKKDLGGLLKSFGNGVEGYAYFTECIFGYEIKEFHKEWVKSLIENRRTCVEAFRGSGKTTMLGVIFPTWVALMNGVDGWREKILGRERRDIRICIVSNAIEHQSAPIIGEIKSAIEGNELLQVLKPNKRDRIWGATKIKTTTNVRVVCRPLNPNVRGGHYDYVICDEGSLFDKRLFYGAVSPMIEAREGNIIVIGTRISESDLLQELKENEEYKSFYYPAIINGKPAWEERYGLGKLKEIERSIGKVDFEREYMLRIISEERRAIPHEYLIRSMNKEIDFHVAKKEGFRYYSGWDLAMSPKGDYWVGITLAYSEGEDRYYLANITRSKGVGYREQVENMLRMHVLYGYEKSVIDCSVYGEVLIGELRQKGMPCEGYVFSPPQRKLLISNLVRVFSEGKIVMPIKRKNEDVDELIKELSLLEISKTPRTNQETYVIRAKHDDALMALALAYQAASVRRVVVGYVGRNKGGMNKKQIGEEFGLDEFGVDLDMNEFEYEFDTEG